MQKGSELCDDPGTLCCFCCCRGKLSAIDAAFAAGILGRRRSANNRTAARPLLCSLFSAVFGNIGASYDSILMTTNYIKPEGFCQFDTCHFRIYLDRHYPSLLSLASESSV